MCGCDCCKSNKPTCFDPHAMETTGTPDGWACKCTCGGCVTRLIQGVMSHVAVQMVNELTDVTTSLDPGAKWILSEDDRRAIATAAYGQGRAEATGEARDALIAEGLDELTVLRVVNALRVRP